MYLIRKNSGSGFLLRIILLLVILFSLAGISKAQVISFRASARTIEAGDSVNLIWDIKRAGKNDTVNISGLGKMRGLKGTIYVKPEISTKYLLTLSGKKKTSKRTIKVTVKKPEIIFFKAPASINPKSQCVLSWNVQNVSKVEIMNEDSYLRLWDSLIVTPSKPTTYVLRACNKNNYCDSDSVRVTIIGDYAGGPKSLRPGESGYLEWSFENATRVSIENVDTNLTAYGSFKISPIKTTRYRFAAHKKTKTGEDTVINEAVTVSVIRTNYIKGSKSYVSLPSGKKLVFDIFAADWTKFPDEIKLKIMVTDTSGNYITGLAPPYCSEYEARKFFKTIIETVEEQRVPVNDFKVTEIRTMQSPPNDISMVLDYSGSMCSYFNKLDKTTKTFIKNKFSEDKVGVVRFDDKIVTESPIMKESSILLDSIPFDDGKTFGGSTALYAAADAGMRLLTDSSRQKHLILMTDGYENSSFAYWGMYYTFAAEVIKEARKNRIKITTIDFAGQANTPLMEALAGMSGGNYYQLKKADDIEKVFAELEHLYHNYYEIIYRPSDLPGNRTIELVYNDNAENLETAITTAYINDTLNIEKIEQEGIESQSSSFFVNNQPVIASQTIALFDFNKSELLPDSKKKLDVMVAYLKKNPKQKIMIVGHSDMKGSENYCFEISYKRAAAVHSYLIRKGIASSRITFIGSGKNSPLWPLEDVEWKARENRRVEILFLQ